MNDQEDHPISDTSGLDTNADLANSAFVSRSPDMANIYYEHLDRATSIVLKHTSHDQLRYHIQSWRTSGSTRAIVTATDTVGPGTGGTRPKPTRTAKLIRGADDMSPDTAPGPIDRTSQSTGFPFQCAGCNDPRDVFWTN